MTLDEGIIHAKDVARNNHEAAIYLADEHPTQAEKCEACASEHRQLAEWLKELKAYKEQSGDAISRQAVLDMLNDIDAEVHGGCGFMYNHWMDYIERLPSVTPQQKMGRWILTDDDFVYCSECEDSYYPRPIDASWYYCPHCGAKMEVEE